MLIIPSLDLQAGRSRLVWWPGAASGSGTPSDRPAAIAEALVAQGAPMIHLVDVDGARQGRPVNVEAIGAVARAVARPLQVAGGIDGPEQVELAFAAGATRLVLPLWAVAEEPERLAACLRIGGDWLAVGLDARPASLRDYPWRRERAPTLEALVLELAGAGVHRFVVSHATSATAGSLASRLAGALVGGLGAEVVVAGGAGSLDDLRALRDVGVAGVILGEAIFTGRLDLAEAIQTVG